MEGIVGHSQVSGTKLEKWELLQHGREIKKFIYIYHIAKRKRKEKIIKRLSGIPQSISVGGKK